MGSKQIRSFEKGTYAYVMSAESTRSHNHRHREPIGNGGFLSLTCSFSLLPESEKEKSPRACGLVGGAIIRWSVESLCAVCGSAGRRIVAGSASLVMGCLM